MTPTPTRARVLRPLTALFAVLAVVASACGSSSPDPQTRLSAAFEDTFDGAYTYAFAVEADRAALDSLGDDAGQAAAFLGTFGISGTVDGEDGVSLQLALGAGSPLLEVRSFGEEAFYLNLGLNDFLSLAGAGAFDPRDELAPALDALGFDDEVKTAVLAVLDGEWVGVEGQLDMERIQGLLGAEEAAADDEEIRSAAEELFGDGIGGFFERFVTVAEAEELEDDTERFDVQLQVRELVRAISELNARVGAEDAPGLDDIEADLQDLPETVPGTIIVADDHVTEIRFDLASVGEEAFDGSILLTVTLDDFDDVEPLVAPEGATVLTDEQFTDAIEKLVGLTGALTPAG